MSNVIYIKDHINKKLKSQCGFYLFHFGKQPIQPIELDRNELLKTEEKRK